MDSRGQWEFKKFTEIDMADEKKIITQSFEEAVDVDTDDQLLSNKRLRYLLNGRVFENGSKYIVKNVLGNTLIANGNLPAGNNIGIGWGKNEETGKLYYFNYNDQGYHGIYAFDVIKRNITPILTNLTDTNNVDILRFSPDYLINHVDVIQDNLIYWVDGSNKARKFNINKAVDKSTTGYGTVVIEDFITAYKQTGVYAPPVEYFTDLSRTSNYLYALQFKFVYRFYYDDNEISNFSDWSAVALPPNESYLGQGAITFANNGINVTVQTGNKLVTKIEIGVKINSLDFVGCAMLNKAQLAIVDDATYIFKFYNDGSYWGLDQAKVIRPYNFLPRIPYCQAFVKVAMTYSNFKEGFEPVLINGEVDITYKDIYLPAGTVSQLNNPAFYPNLLSTDEHGGVFNSWYTTVTRFTIGADVKKGNIFVLSNFGGNGDNSVSFTAKLSDTASTIAALVKNYLRTIDAVGTGVVTNDNTDGSGNVSFDFTIEAHEGKNAITFATSVQPVNYTTLLDNGLSINTIKMGSPRKYGIVYEDDDGRTSLTYTCDALLAKTLYETDVLPGTIVPLGIKQPIHTIKIYNQPPMWAKYWRLVRTNDITEFIQLLIQQVNTVTVANEDTYLDLVVGSLLTYQEIHPDTILKYEFKRGDRLRLISDESSGTPTFYTPYYETEILSFSNDTEEFVGSNIKVDGSSNVTPDKAVDPNYIGKNIKIGDTERLIVGISGSSYELDYPINYHPAFDGDGTEYFYPNYTFIDRRGIVRIKKPVGYVVNSLSLVEIYTPPKNTNDKSYQDFFDFQAKYVVSNYGLPNRGHNGNIQNQDGANPISTPAIIQVTQGDSYVRNRAMPSNNQNPNPQVIIDKIVDPNFSDFYESNLYDTGRVYPQDQGYGEVTFGSRVRFSNNYIEDTRINGLNDFDNPDREDYNDPYNSITLTKFKQTYLFLFKKLRTSWTPVGQKFIVDNNGSRLLATSDKLLNDLEYSQWEGGIGDNGEGWFENGNYQYIPSANSGVYLRIAQDGSIPISKTFSYDKKARSILSNVNRYNLKVIGGYDRLNDEAIFSTPDFIKYIFNNRFNAGDWKTVTDAYPAGTAFIITQQPAHATATINGSLIEITGTSTLGNDFFKFKGQLPDSSFTPESTFCFEVIPNTDKTIVYTIETDSSYCLHTGPNNNGQQGWKILLGSYQVDGSPVDSQMPNVVNISPDAIVPLSATITYNTYADVAPTGGVDSDVWYNLMADALYKKVAGVWSLLTNRVNNTFYAAPIQNRTACPIPSGAIGILLVDVLNSTTANLYVYVDNPTTGGLYRQAVYTGNNFYQNFGQAGAANSYLLSSDVSGSEPNQRFAVNFTKMVDDFPGQTSFTVKIAGRDTAANTLSGQFSLKGVGTLVMSGSPGTYIPGVVGSSAISTGSFTSAPMAIGADGTYGYGVGATILTFVYDVLSNTVTQS